MSSETLTSPDDQRRLERSAAYTPASSLPKLGGQLAGSSSAPAFTDVWPAIDAVRGFLVPGQERWLFNAALQQDDGAVIVEIGSFLGRSTTAMAFACQGTNRRIYAIDTFKGNDSDFKNGLNAITWEGDDYLETFKANLRANDLLRYVTPIQGLSHAAGASWDKPIDFLFVDGSHEFDDVMQDFSDFFPWLKPGGLIAFHDVLPNRDGPYRAWREHIRHQVDAPSSFFSIAYGQKPLEPAETSARIHVIIPVHNRLSMTRSCLKQIGQQSIADRLSITVVDDGSRDGTRKMLATEFPDIRVIEGDGELFWAGAAAKAIEELRADFTAGDFFLMVNNDARLSPESIETLVATSEAYGRAGVAPAAISDGQAISTGWAPGSSTILNNFERQFDVMTNGGNAVEVKALFGRCSLFPVEILDPPNVGNYDAETFRHYYGDTDFCQRAGAAGFRFFVTGSTCIRIVVDSRTTGTHHAFRQGPQPWSAVWQNLTSVKSIDNIEVTWRYMSRHHRDRRIANTLAVAWRSLRYWRPVYNGLGLKPLAERGNQPTKRRNNTGLARAKHYVKRSIYYLFHPISAFRKAASLAARGTDPQGMRTP